jgi:hypothetical protein
MFKKIGENTKKEVIAGVAALAVAFIIFVSNEIYALFTRSPKLSINEIVQIGLHTIKIEDTVKQYFKLSASCSGYKKKELDSISSFFGRGMWSNKEISFASSTLKTVQLECLFSINQCENSLIRIKKYNRRKAIPPNCLTSFEMGTFPQIASMGPAEIVEKLEYYQKSQEIIYDKLNGLLRSIESNDEKECGEVEFKVTVINTGNVAAAIKAASIKFYEHAIKYNIDGNMQNGVFCPIVVKPLPEGESVVVCLKPSENQDMVVKNIFLKEFLKTENKFQIILETTAGRVDEYVHIHLE